MSEELDVEPTERDWWSQDVELRISGERRAVAAVIGTLNAGMIAIPASFPDEGKCRTTEESMIWLSRLVSEEFVGIAILEESERVGLDDVPESAIRDIPMDRARTHGTEPEDFLEISVDVDEGGDS